MDFRESDLLSQYTSISYPETFCSVETDYSTNNRFKQYELFNQKLYNEGSGDGLANNVLQECEQWKTAFPHLRIIGKTIYNNSPGKLERCINDDYEEVFAEHYDEQEVFYEKPTSKERVMNSLVLQNEAENWANADDCSTSGSGLFCNTLDDSLEEDGRYLGGGHGRGFAHGQESDYFKNRRRTNYSMIDDIVNKTKNKKPPLYKIPRRAGRTASPANSSVVSSYTTRHKREKSLERKFHDIMGGGLLDNEPYSLFSSPERRTGGKFTSPIPSTKTSMKYRIPELSGAPPSRGSSLSHRLSSSIKGFHSFEPSGTAIPTRLTPSPSKLLPLDRTLGGGTGKPLNHYNKIPPIPSKKSSTPRYVNTGQGNLDECFTVTKIDI